jgi:hypothetical protein
MQRQRRIRIATIFGLLLPLSICWTISAQQARPAAQEQAGRPQAAPVPRPSVVFHAGWKIPPGPDPRRIFTQEWVSNPNLELKLYGPGTKGHGLEHQDEPRFKDFAGSLIVNTQADIDWAYIWSGFAEGNWAFTLRDKNNFLNVTGAFAKIRIKSWQSGFQLLRPVIKTADGKYYVGDQAVGPSTDWTERDMVVADIHWLGLNPMTAAELGGGSQNPDLSRIDEVGVTTLRRGVAPGSVSSSRVGWIEVVGQAVPRGGKTN